MNGYEHPYNYHPLYQKRVAYFCMEYGIDQNLKIYSGGLGYLAGSHMRSAFSLGQNLIGIGILWKYGYYDQIRRSDQSMDVLFLERNYSFLKDTGIVFDIEVNNHPVKVKAWYLAPDVFQTAPLYLLSTDLPENDHLAQTICHRLYDSDLSAKVAQYILLGIGGSKLLERLNYEPDYIHLNEAHALPAAFYKMSKPKSKQPKFVLTTHTPVPAGNEEHDIHFLHRMGFFDALTLSEIREITKIEGDRFNLTLGALRISHKANGVSKMHGEVAREMWSAHGDIPRIDHVTNAQKASYWEDPILNRAIAEDSHHMLRERKKQLKRELFKIVADQTGKVFHEEVLTMVWARRFAGYKRADMLLWDMELFEELVNSTSQPIQIIWAGKPYPLDQGAIAVYNHIIHTTKRFSNCAVVVGYELRLSKRLKQGSDIWLNTPRVTREASGTSGMTAAMNASLNFSTFDGWIPEFAKHGHNSFIIPTADPNKSIEEQDKDDHKNLFKILTEDILPKYYIARGAWYEMQKNSMKEVIPFFDSDRMAREYYERLYVD